MARAADEVEAAFSKVHIVCNNAGVAVVNNLLQFTPTEWNWIFGANMFGVAHGVQTFVPRIRKHGEGGHIVNTASMGGLQINPAIPDWSLRDDEMRCCRIVRDAGARAGRQRHRGVGAMSGAGCHNNRRLWAAPARALWRQLQER
jgi:NAD(P)-dependent dehydrogenase (short-subunit alcohol dehydrogenase family)